MTQVRISWAIPWLICIVALTCFYTSARGSEAANNGATTRSTTQAAPTTSATEVPLIYDQRLNHDPLPESDVSSILKFTKQVTHLDRKVWFILVHYSRTSSPERDWNATVYFVPERTTPRLRTGRSVSVDSLRFRWWPTMSKNAPDTKYHVDEYYQVAEPEHPFADKLDLPDPLLWPFPRPSDISETDMIELVDLVRTEMRLPHKGSVGVTCPNAPIHQFQMGQNGEIKVYTGSQQHGLAGCGDLFTCVKQNGKWVVKSMAFWVS